MNEEAIKLLYEDLQTEYDVGTLNDFSVYLKDDTKREKFFNEIILPRYDVASIDEFETTYGLKKKEDTELPFADGLSERGEATKKFQSSLKRLAAGASRIPTYIAEMAVTGAGLINPEFKDYYNSLSIDDRELFLETLGKQQAAIGATGIVGLQDVGNEAYRKLTNEAEQLEATMEQFDTSITEDIFSENVIRGTRRLVNEAVGAIPSVLAAFTPGGIAVIGAGEAASKSRELQEQGKDLDLRTAINATGSGIAEGVFEGVTRKLGKGLFKSLSGKTEEQALIGITRAVGGILKGMGLEGSSEVGTLISQQALDKWVSQDEDAFVDIIKQGLDTFLIGAAVGGPISGLDVGVRKYTQVKAAKNLNKTIEKTKYDNLVSAFTPAEGKPTLELDQIDIINDPNAKTFLEGTLLKQVKRNELSQDAADKILESYDKTVSLYYDVANLNLTREQQIEAAGLIEEKKQIENLIAGKDEALVKKERNRINEINSELERISEESGGVTTIKEATKEDALKALAEEGVLSPTDDQILNKLDELTKIKEDAIQEPSPEKVDVQEPAPDSEAVGERDIQQQPIAGEITPEQVETTTQPTEEIEAEVEVTPSEIETYTLPEDPRKAKKDFEIIDNRDGFFQAVDEDGSNKWILRNIKTGLIGTTSTKGEAQQFLNNTVNKQGMTMDYGEGQPVLEEFRTKVTEEVVEAPIEAAPTDKVRQIGNFEVILTEDNVIKSIKKNGKEVSDQGRRNAEKQIIQAGQIDVTKGKKAQLDEGMSPEEVSEVIARESSNPSEIATEIDIIKEKKKNKKRSLQERKQSGLPSLFGTKFTPKSIIDVFGVKPSELGQGFTRTWVSKTGEDLKDGFIDPNGIKFNKDQVAEFLEENPSEAKYNREFLNKLPQLQKDLENRFQEITGITPTEGNIKLASSPEKIAEVAERAIFEAERKAEEKPIITKEEKKISDVKKLELDEEVQKDVNALSRVFDKITPKILELNLGNIYNQLKNLVTRRGVVSEDVRGLPLSKVDLAFGNKNSTLIYDTVFKPLASSYSRLSNNLRKKIKIAEDQAQKLYREAKDHNKAIENGYRISIALKALEAESNPDSDKVNNVADELKATIREARRGNILTEKDGNVLEGLLKQYEKDGQIKFEDVYNSLSNVQKNVFETIKKENKELESFAVKAAGRRGIDLETLNNYTHRVVLGSPQDMVDLVKQQAKNFADPSTKAGTIIERTEGVKPVSFDPFESYLRGTQETYLDYYMTPDVFKVQDVSKAIQDKYIDANKGQRESGKALNSAVREILQATYLRSFLRTKGTVANEIQKMGYRAMLASIPRAGAELAGNAIMLSIQPTQVLRDAVTTYAPISMKQGESAKEKYTDILTNLGSTEVDKVGGRLVADTKFSDPNNFLSAGDLGRQSFKDVRNKMDAVIGLGKKGYKKLNELADILMGGADKATSRPLWISRFAYDFANNVKKFNNENIKLTVKDFNEIADGTSPYLSDKYKQAREKAAASSDKIIIELVTSGNPFNAIIKNVRRPGDNRNFYRRINSFMANFTLNEYATARYAIGALQRSGDITKKQAVMTLAALLGRMSSYMLAYSLFSDVQDGLFGVEEEEEDAMELFAARQAIGSAAQLMFRQNLGNVASLPINAGIEFLNKNYLESLREGKPYNAYENAITFSLINLDELSDEGILETVALVGAGPYSSLLKALSRSVKNIARELEKDTPPSADVKKDLILQSAFDIGGNTGLVPAYRDIKRVLDKKKYGGRDLAKPSKTTLKELDLINPELAKEIREINKQFRDIEKAFED